MGSCSGIGSPGKAPRSGSRSNSDRRTGAPVMPSNDAGPTNRVAPSVISTRTPWPAFVARRTSSSALYAEIPPVTPSRMRAIGPSWRRPAPTPLGAVLELELALGELLEGDREVVLAALGVHHRRRVLAEVPLTEVVVVAVDLTGALGSDDDRRIVRVGLRQQPVHSWLDHPVDECSGRPISVRTMRSSSAAARSTSSLTTR